MRLRCFVHQVLMQLAHSDAQRLAYKVLSSLKWDVWHADACRPSHPGFRTEGGGFIRAILYYSGYTQKKVV